MSLLKHAKINKFIKYTRNYTGLRYLSSINRDNIIRSPVSDITLPDKLLHEYIWDIIPKWHDKIALECAETERNIKYSEIRNLSENLAGFLQKIGLKQRQTVAIILPNLPEYFIAIFGTLSAGLVVTTVNPAYTADEIKRQLIASKTKFIFTSNQLYSTVKNAAESIPNAEINIAIINESQNESVPSGCIKFSEACATKYKITYPNWSLDEVALLPYSSGTTGLSKGVQLTHRNVTSNFVQGSAKEYMFWNETTASNQDVVPLVLPAFHIYGLSYVSLSYLSRGVKIVTLPKFSSKSYFDMIYKYNPSLLFIVPPIVLMMLNQTDFKLEKLTALRYVASGAAPLGAADINRFRDRTNDTIHLIQLYGLTETSPLTHGQTVHLPNGIKIGGSGFPLPNTFSKFCEIGDDKFKALPPNQSGELLIKGPQVMKGYLNNDEANANTFTHDGWLRTGDIGHYDEHNHFFITDRLKELIKVSGFQVPPAELEELLRDHPDIKDAAVIGVPDDKKGEVPKAFIVFHPNSKSTPQDIFNYVAGKTVKYKHLAGGVVSLETIPKTASGKILRRELKLM